MITNIVLLRTESGRRLVEGKCNAADLNIEVLEQLIDVQIKQLGKQKRRGIWDDIDAVFDRWDEDRRLQDVAE